MEENKPKIIFLTFGAGSSNYHDAVNRICNQAKMFDLFDNIYGFTEVDLMNDNDFWTKHSKFILNNKKGYGYWIWKGHLIKKVMEKANYGDIVIYVDSGCELNIRGKQRLLEYFDLVRQYKSLYFQMVHKEKTYSKMSLIKHLNLSENDIDEGHLVCGIQLYEKTDENMFFLNELNELYCHNNYEFVNDSPSIIMNDITFRDHRHDQSCLSCLCKKYKRKYILNDETWFQNWNDGINYPIFAVRNRGGKSHLY